MKDLINLLNSNLRLVFKYVAIKYEVFSTRERELFQEYLTLLGTLEYNIHQTKLQQRLLDDLVDIVVTVSLFSLLFLVTPYVMGDGFTTLSLFDICTGPGETLST